MATNEKAIEILIDCAKDLATAVDGLFAHQGKHKWVESSVKDRLSVLARDSSAGAPEIDLCVSCKQRPCGCAKEPFPSTVKGICRNCGNSGIGIDKEACVCPTGQKLRTADKPCEHGTFKRHNTGVVGIGYVPTFVCTECGHVGRIDKVRGRGIEWWPTSSPVCDPVPPWKADPLHPNPMRFLRINEAEKNRVLASCPPKSTRRFAKELQVIMEELRRCVEAKDYRPAETIVNEYFTDPDFLNDSLRPRQNEVAKAAIEDLKREINQHLNLKRGWIIDKINAKLASLGGA